VGTIVHSNVEGVPDTSPFEHLHTSGERNITAWSEYIRDNSVTNHAPRLRNVAFFIEGGSGKVVDEYAKRNLWHPERDYLTPGEAGHQVFETRWGRCAFLICKNGLFSLRCPLTTGWDVSHPAAGQALTKLDVDIVFAPTYWIGYDSAP
jgi:predicted amidohydrolase